MSMRILVLIHINNIQLYKVEMVVWVSMCTLYFRGTLRLVSVTVHESIHSWFQGLLATNESKYEWMDEGFARMHNT